MPISNGIARVLYKYRKHADDEKMHTEQSRVISALNRAGFKRISSELIVEIDKRIKNEITADDIAADIYRHFRADLLSTDLGIKRSDPEFHQIELMIDGAFDDSTIRWVIQRILTNGIDSKQEDAKNEP
ncbi:hypothetical protein NT239_05805 [Chitinibacter sp. SCUT-21]|uniref:hypothetical protein n=1 Tax=Chitinibacter sp. SCUT-21 TaxID=2970891 RepID=UPI0035A6B336